MDHEHWMRLAVEQARDGIEQGQTPFGAVIVRDGVLVGAGHNQVWRRTDPTAHAEVVCIQNTCGELGTIDLRGCTMYTTCEPCPMCASAIHWSKLDAVCYGACIADAQRAGFSELTLPIDELYARGGSPVRVLPRALTADCVALFAAWKEHPQRRHY